jgi:hypothetical protein
VYITDKESKSVLQISPDGKDASVVLNESDSIGEPLAIRFSRDYCRLYVGSNQSTVFEYSKIFLPSNVMQCTFFESVKIIESFDRLCIKRTIFTMGLYGIV